MPPKISKKRTYSKRSIIQENQNKKLGKNSDSEKRFKKGEELKNYQTRSYLKRDIQSNMKLSDELIKENLENSTQNNMNKETVFKQFNNQKEELKQVEIIEKEYLEDLKKDLEIKQKTEINDLFDEEYKFKKPLECAAKSFLNQNTKKLLIDPKLITYRYLDSDRYPLINGKLLIIKNLENVEIIKEIFDNIDNYRKIKNTIYLRGPSGIGKSYSLIQTIFEIKQNHSDKFRIIHLILNRDYVEIPFKSFCYDFLYCFINDFNDSTFPLPPSFHSKQECQNENLLNVNKSILWFKYLYKHSNRKWDIFAEDISNYLEMKKIRLILVWDQDNVYQNIKKEIPLSNSISFLESIRISPYFDFKIISASNNNEGFQNLINTDLKIELNNGFTKKDSLFYIKILKIINKIDFVINESEIYDITNGNCYLINQFMNEKGNNYKEKYNSFNENIEIAIRGRIAKFFGTFKNFREDWVSSFPFIPFYLDSDYKIPSDIIDYADKNYTYIDNGFLKSVNLLSKKFFLNYYFQQLSYYDRVETSFIYMENIVKNEFNPALKGILFEKFLIEKISHFNNRDIQFQCYSKSNKKESLKLRFTRTENFYTNNELNKFIEKSNVNLLLVPLSHKHRNFDFAIWDYSQSKLYLFQITITIINHKKSDESFFENLNIFQLKPNQIQFVWLGFEEEKDNKLLWNHLRNNSWFLNYKEIKFPQRYVKL